MSRSHTSARVTLAAVVASAALVFAAPAAARPYMEPTAAQPAVTHHQVLPSGHKNQSQTPVQQPVAVSSQTSSSDGYGWSDLMTVAAAALFGAGVTLGGMTLYRRHDQPLST